MINLIKIVFSDVSTLYKNFLHWNFSKIIISICRYLIGILFALPFFIAFLIILFSFLDWRFLFSTLASGGMGTDFLMFLYSNIFVVILLILIFSSLIISFLVGFSYGKVLLLDLNIKYLEGKKLPYWNKSYFDFKFIWKYTKVLGWVLLYLLIPVVVFFVIFIILFFVFGGTQGLPNQSGGINIFSVLSLILLFVSILVTIYLLYRLSFSYIILLDKKNYPEEEKAKFYVKESLKLTSSFTQLSKLFIIVLLFSILIVPFKIAGNIIDREYNGMRDYVNYSNLLQKGKQLSDKKIYDFNILKLSYANIESIELSDRIDKYSFYQTLFYIFYYLFIFGVFEIVFVSFYRHELKGKHKSKPVKNFFTKIFIKKK